MNVTFTPDQFSQLLDLILTTNFLSFFAAITVYDFLKVLIYRFTIRFTSNSSILVPRKIDFYKIARFIRKSHRRMDFENYYQSIRQFIHKSCA